MPHAIIRTSTEFILGLGPTREAALAQAAPFITRSMRAQLAAGDVDPESDERAVPLSPEEADALAKEGERADCWDAVLTRAMLAGQR
jgi:hypothetical protein